MDTLSVLLIISAVAALGALVIKILSAPMKLITKLLINTAVGYVLLFVCAFLAEFFDVSIELNLLNAVIVGVFGVPGIILLVLLALFL